MKRLITILAVLVVVFVASASADAVVRVRGSFRSNGTYVYPHYRSNPDRSFYNNWSTYPNVNPYTGTIGTRQTPSYQYSPAPRYYSPSSSRFRSYSGW
jgi:hypothetical protein